MRPLHEAIERSRRRIWAISYRMTGNVADADDLAQEAVARAIEKSAQCREADPTGWLIRLTTRLCIDHLRRAGVERRANAVADPLHGATWTIGEARSASDSPEAAAVLREDLRFALIVALQRLSVRQRAALILSDVLDCTLVEVAETLGTNANAAKALLHRARTALAAAGMKGDVDVPVDAATVDRFARAIESGSVEAISGLFAGDIWGVVDGGDLVPGSKKPTYGARAVTRQWANARKKLGDIAVKTQLASINGEPAVLIALRDAPGAVIALVHVETRGGTIASQRVLRDPRRLTGGGR